MNLSLTTYDSALLNKIGSDVCQTIITIQEQQPELLLERYRKVSWCSGSKQSALMVKLTEELSQSQDWNSLLKTLQKYLKALLIPESFDAPILRELLQNISQLKPEKFELNGAANTESSKKTGIAVLLLDAENLQLNTETEHFLTTVCTCPIQVKIAFANWRSMGKLDVEFHGRGYDLIHVPPGRDNADGKMIAFGSSIHEHYPKVKEVFVCSSDKVMTNLCNHLQQNGLTVYRVSKQKENLTIFNSSTGKIINYSVASMPEIPSIKQFINQLKQLIKSEQKRTKSYWIKLATLSQVFNSKYKLTISQIVSQHFPGKKARDIFVTYPAEFVLHQIDENSELYVTLFEITQDKQANSNQDEQPSSAVSPALSGINSKADLEQALKDIITTLTIKSNVSYVSVSNLGSQFSQDYGKPITEQIKSLQINGNFLKFLQSCSSFELKETKKGWSVAVSNLQ